MFLLMALMAVLTVSAQYNDIYEQDQPVAKVDKADKAKKKVLQARVDSLGHEMSLKALSDGYWVLQADQLSVTQSAYIESGLDGSVNFIYQNADECVIQTSLNNGLPGLNGMGGVTLRGKVSNHSLKVDEKGNAYYSFHVVSEDVNADVTVTLYAGSERAFAMVDPVFGFERFSFSGCLSPYVAPDR